MVDEPKGLERYDAGAAGVILDGEFEEVKPDDSAENKAEAPKQETPKQEAPKQEAPKQETPKQEAPKQEAPKGPDDDISDAEFEEIKPKAVEEPEVDDGIQAEAARRKQRQQQQEEQSQSAPKPKADAGTKSNLSQQEQQALHERVLGRENAVDGLGSHIHMANGKELLDMSIKIGGEERDFVGYKSRFRRMDEDTALTIVLMAKEKGWDSIDVHGSKRSRDMLASVAQEHGLAVGNHPVPDAKPTSKFEDVQPEVANPSVDAAPDVEPEPIKVEPIKVEPIKIEPITGITPDSQFTQPQLEAPIESRFLPEPEKPKALPAPEGPKALPGPEGQKALPAPEGQKALPAPEGQKALPAPKRPKAGGLKL